MALGAAYSQSMNDAVTTAVSAGVLVVTAAGNSNSDACDVQPYATNHSLL